MLYIMTCFICALNIYVSREKENDYPKQAIWEIVYAG